MAGKDQSGQPAHQKHLSYLDVLGEYITRTRDLTAIQGYFIPKIRNFESKGMDRVTSLWYQLRAELWASAEA
jgi:hypothetical protein